jgi:hypothetical protein
MRPIVVTTGPYAAANISLIAASQTPSAGVAFTLTGTQPDVARRIVIAAGSEGAPRAVTLVGTDRTGQPRTEVITIASASAGNYGSVLDYATVTSLTSSTTFTAAATVGTIATSSTNAPFIGSSAWARLDDYGFAPVAVQVDVTLAGGTITYTVESSLDDPNVIVPAGITTGTYLITPQAMTWVADPNLTTQTTSKQDAMVARAVWARVSITAYTGNALTTGTFSQAGGRLG